MTYPVMSAVKWHRTYFSMIATPLSVRDIVVVHLGFVLARVALTSGGLPAGDGAVRGVLVGCRRGRSPSSSQLLIGLAFATPAVRAHRVDEGRERLLADLPARDDPDVPVLRRLLPGRQPRPASWSSSRGSPRCGTASTSPACSPSAHVQPGPGPWCTSSTSAPSPSPASCSSYASWRGGWSHEPGQPRRGVGRGSPALDGRGDRADRAAQLPRLPRCLVGLRQRLPRAGASTCSRSASASAS